jgi:colicin import membrane protein
MATMSPTAAAGAPYRVPRERTGVPSMVLAALMHAGLILFLWAGISWQNNAPVQVEAEVWDMKVQAAAPPPPPPQPVVEETPAAPPPPPPAKVAPPVEQPPAVKPPDIALERAKQKEEQKKLLEEKKLEEKLARAKQELADKKAQELADKKAQELADKKAAEKAADKAAEKAAADKKLADKQAKAKLAAAEQKKLDAVRDAEMRRITGAAGTTGEAAKSTAPRSDSGYQARITSKIKSTTSYLGNTDVPGNPRVEFRIEELPTGEILSVKKIKSSGVPAFDDAVERGINKASPLPKKDNGTVERTLDIGFSMKDLN